MIGNAGSNRALWDGYVTIKKDFNVFLNSMENHANKKMRNVGDKLFTFQMLSVKRTCNASKNFMLYQLVKMMTSIAGKVTTSVQIVRKETCNV